MRQISFRFLISVSILLFAVRPASVCPTTQHVAKKPSDASMRQTLALTVLDGVIDEQLQIEEIPTRIEISEKLISLLGKRNPARCRQLLNSLFDAAMARLSESRPSRSSGSHNSDLTGSLHKIIQIAAGFDRKLAEAYMTTYTEALQQNENNSTNPSRASADAYLHLGRALLDKNVPLAVSVAEKSLAGGIVLETLVFIEMLRGKDASLADQFVLSSLRSVRALEGPNVDVNEILVLYSYLFSPLLVPVMTPEGMALYQIPELQNLPAQRTVNAVLARQFLGLSAEILLDPARRAAGGNASYPMGDFCFIRLVEPQAREYLPQVASRLSTQGDLILAGLAPDRRAQLESSAGTFQGASRRERENKNDEAASLEALLRKVDDLSDSDEKDLLYFEAATAAIRLKKYSLALQIVNKISLKNLDAARQLVSFNIAQARVKEGEFEEAEQLAQRDDDLTRRAYILTLVASSLVIGRTKELERASTLLNEVTRLASKLQNDREKVATLTGAAAVFSYFDQVRAFDIFREAIDIANKLTDFNGDMSVDRLFEIKGFSFVYRMYDKKFTFTEVILRQGAIDFNLTLSDVRNIKSRAPRLKAMITLCSTVLS